MSTVFCAGDAQDVVKAGLPLDCIICLSVDLVLQGTLVHCKSDILIKLPGRLTLRGVAPHLYTCLQLLMFSVNCIWIMNEYGLH